MKNKRLITIIIKKDSDFVWSAKKYLGFFFVLFVFLTISCKKEKNIYPFIIDQGKFEASFIETGELQAVNAYTLIAPDLRQFGRKLMIIELIEHGKEVNEGEIVAKFDPSDILNYIVEQQISLDQEIANLNKLQAQQESRNQQFIAELETAVANYDMKKLELEKFQFESEKKKEIKKLEFEQATINLNNVKRKIELEKNITQNELKIQKIKVQQREKNIKNAETSKKYLNLISHSKGIAQIGTNWRNGQMIRQGDEVWRGMPIVNIPDISQMKVLSKVNETDIMKLKIGQNVIIRLDAYPNKPFEGIVSDIGKLSYSKDEKSKIKVFDVEILAKESDPSLKPGMTVSCEFLFANFDQAFFVPNECIEKNTVGYYIYKKQGTGFEKQKVKTGPSNNTHTVLLGQFKKGTPLITVSEIKNQTIHPKNN